MLRHALVFAAALAAAWLARTEVAEAGGCEPCATSAECVAMFGEPAYCVRFSAKTGCGDTLQYCCPGQGCSADEDGPSCAEDGRCVVVDRPGADGGPTTGTDGGPMTGTDGGPTTGTDGGPTTGTDGGPTTGRDGGGMAGADGGGTVPPSGDGGCCSVAPGAPLPHAAGGLLCLALVVAAVARRRSRRP